MALIVLGPKRLPEVGRGLGAAIRDFKGSLSGADITDKRPAPEPLSEPDISPADPTNGSRPEDTGAR